MFFLAHIGWILGTPLSYHHTNINICSRASKRIIHGNSSSSVCIGLAQEMPVGMAEQGRAIGLDAGIGVYYLAMMK